MKAEPKPTAIVCEACGLPWSLHKNLAKRPTLATCVKLLRDELSKRPSRWPLPFYGAQTGYSAATGRRYTTNTVYGSFDSYAGWRDE